MYDGLVGSETESQLEGVCIGMNKIPTYIAHTHIYIHNQHTHHTYTYRQAHNYRGARLRGRNCNQFLKRY